MKHPGDVSKAKLLETIEVTVRGRVIARIVPEAERQAAARQWLQSLRKTARVGDVMSPSGEAW